MGSIEAGKGRAQRFLLPSMGEAGKATLSRLEHYVRIEVRSWFVNKPESFWKERMASGIVKLKLGDEDYNAALGAFQLEGTNSVAPVFDRPLIWDRCYPGGGLTIACHLVALKRDKRVAALLKSAMVASLNIAQGMVQTATPLGPTKVVAEAGEALIGGVKEWLTERDDTEPIFDKSSGIEFTLSPEQLESNEMHVLLHRGEEIANHKRITIASDDSGGFPLLDGEPIRDGAWVLFRIRKLQRYSGPKRAWDREDLMLRDRLDALLNAVELKVKSVEDAEIEFKPGTKDVATVYDDAGRLALMIRADPVLTPKEATVRIAQIWSRISLARKALTEDKPAEYLVQQIESMSQVMKAGLALPEAFAQSVHLAAGEVAQTRQLVVTSTQNQLLVEGIDFAGELGQFFAPLPTAI